MGFWWATSNPYAGVIKSAGQVIQTKVWTPSQQSNRVQKLFWKPKIYPRTFNHTPFNHTRIPTPPQFHTN
ncbi:MAG: hypothetical protein DRR19_11310 [Candidatus Parabeggiatoa sp. nov. 1]|nr:MAG: hypothetical protein DRR19_11310 [Gammaproteobacteria bacterium]